MEEKVYTSRSREEVFLDCPRKGYLEFLWEGRGVVKKGVSVYLSTGTYFHQGMEILFLAAKAGTLNDETLDYAVVNTNANYRQEIEDRGFDLEDGERKEFENYVVNEQTALIEGMIRLFYYRIMPDILARYNVIDVEREEIMEVENLVIQGKIDVVLEEKDSGDIYIVSFKTSAGWDKRQAKSNEHDNQGLSETLLLEHRLQQSNLGLDTLIPPEKILRDLQSIPKAYNATKKYIDYLSQFRKKDKVMGVLMIYLIKGKRYETEKDSGKWEQHSPLVRAYRKLTGVKYEYAPSLYFDKPENKSGKGRLGKGWEPFLVWEDEEIGGVKGWISKLASGEIAGGEKILDEQFRIPAPYFRNQGHIDSWFRQLKAVEQRIHDNVISINPSTYSPLNEQLDYYFPQRRKGCHYPSDCSYLDVCYTEEIFNDPIGSGKYVYRKPHHEAEEKAHEILYQITNAKDEEKGSRNNSKGSNNDDDEVIDG